MSVLSSPWVFERLSCVTMHAIVLRCVEACSPCMKFLIAFDLDDDKQVEYV